MSNVNSPKLINQSLFPLSIPRLWTVTHSACSVQAPAIAVYLIMIINDNERSDKYSNWLVLGRGS